MWLVGQGLLEIPDGLLTLIHNLRSGYFYSPSTTVEVMFPQLLISWTLICPVAHWSLFFGCSLLSFHGKHCLWSCSLKLIFNPELVFHGKHLQKCLCCFSIRGLLLFASRSLLLFLLLFLLALLFSGSCITWCKSWHFPEIWPNSDAEGSTCGNQFLLVFLVLWDFYLCKILSCCYRKP